MNQTRPIPTERRAGANGAAAARRRRRGAVMILMFALLFAFMGLAALVIDFGIVRATQAKMRSAADPAALEALRYRDQFPPFVAGQAQYVAALGLNPNDAADVATARDHARRVAADNLLAVAAGRAAAGSADDRFGMGPLFRIETSNALGANPTNAGERLRPTDPPSTYQPTLESNDVSNLIEGDVVAGAYDADPFVSHTDGRISGEGGTTPPTYQRLDFTAAAPGARPTANAQAPAAFAPAALVRLRRTGETFPAGVGASGPALPLLFGMAAAIRAAPAGAYSVRRDGVRIRTAAIAEVRPAVFVGPPQAITDADGQVVSTVAGVGPVAIDRAVWEDAALLPPPDAQGAAVPVAVVVLGNELRLAARPDVRVGVLVGTTRGVQIGQPVASLPGGSAASLAVADAYFPIADAAETGNPTMIGFGRARIGANDGGLTISRLSDGSHGAVAPTNATADLTRAWPALAALPSDAARDAVRQANGGVRDAAGNSPANALRDPVLSPVLVRATGN